VISSATIKGVTNIVLFDLRGTFKRRLTNSSAIDVSPSWSPDGRKVAFCSNRGGGPQIYLMNADGSNPRRVSFTDSTYCTSPSWSPKGDKIAFVCRDGGNQIYISDPEGKRAIQLTFAGNNEDPAWAPDGRSLAFSSNLGRGGPRNVVVYSLLGNTTSQITFAKSEDSMPAWSPRIP
jgi:TolB protein